MSLIGGSMRKLINKLKSKKSLNQKGQGAVEYVLIIGVAAMLVIAFKDPIKKKIEELTGKAGNKADEVFQ